MTPQQQQWLLETAEEAGKYNNEVQQKTEKEYLDKMKKEGVTVVVPSPEVLAGFKKKAESFYAKVRNSAGPMAFMKRSRTL